MAIVGSVTEEFKRGGKEVYVVEGCEFEIAFEEVTELSDHPIHSSMAAPGSASLHGPLFQSFSRLFSQLGDRPRTSLGLGVASALTVGSLTFSKASALAEKKAVFEKVRMQELINQSLPVDSNCVTSFASLSLVPLEDVVESRTGVVFPGASPEGKQLTGVGLRKKKILGLKNITVYAYGLYADPHSLRSTLGTKYESFTPAELSNKEELFADVTQSDVGLTIRLVIVYGKLKIGSIRSAFEESVGKGLKKFSGDDNKELLGRFTNIFTDDLMLPKGTTIDISRLPGQVLQTEIDGQVIGSVQSPLLCQALFDLYIGDDAFDKPAKETMGLGFGTIISG